jgi:hypothetical protein
VLTGLYYARKWVTNSFFCEPGSSVSIVPGYGLGERVMGVRSPAEAKGFFPLASVSRSAMGPTQPPVGFFAGAKVQPGNYADH